MNQADVGDALAELGVETRLNRDRAQALYLEAAEGFRDAGWSWHVARTQGRLAETMLRQRRWLDAKAAYEIAIAQIEQIRSTIRLTRDRQDWMEQNTLLFKGIVEACLQLRHDRDALEYVERGRSRALVDQLYSEELVPTNAPPDLVATYRQVQRRLLELDAALEPTEWAAPALAAMDIDNRDLSRSRSIQERLDLRQELQVLEDNLRRVDPDFFALAQPLDVSEMVDLAGRLDRTLVHIWVEEAQAALFCVTPDGAFDCILLPNVSDSLVQSWVYDDSNEPSGYIWNYLHYRNRQISRDAWMTHLESMMDLLYDRIAKPIHSFLSHRHLKRVAVIVGGPIGLLPLHAARWKDDRGQAHYLADELDIVYAPAAWVLQRCFERERADWLPALVVGEPSRSGPLPLPFSAWEAERIAQQIGETADRSAVRCLTHEDATASRVRDLLRTHALVHFSCHGFWDFSNPLRSSLVLADSNLALADLLASAGLMNRTKLVVLSSCETGAGYRPNSNAEEFLGLPSGFIVAGAATVVCSLWPVSDAPTALLMAKLYEFLLDSSSATLALSQAQRWLRTLSRREAIDAVVAIGSELINGALTLSPVVVQQYVRWLSLLGEFPFSRPYYWAAFSVFGVSATLGDVRNRAT